MDGEGTVLDQELMIAASKFLPIDKNLAPVGDPAPVAMTLLDIAANVSEALGDEPFVINDYEGEPDQEMADARVFADIEEFADQEIAEENALHDEE